LTLSSSYISSLHSANELDFNSEEQLFLTEGVGSNLRKSCGRRGGLGTVESLVYHERGGKVLPQRRGFRAEREGMLERTSITPEIPALATGSATIVTLNSLAQLFNAFYFIYLDSYYSYILVLGYLTRSAVPLQPFMESAL